MSGDFTARQEEQRPWGCFRVQAEEPDFKVKTIIVGPGKRLSLQRHARRSEHWFIVAGQGIVTKDSDLVPLEPGQAVDIPVGTWHRMHNPSTQDLVFIEVQTGDYFGEDDIERKEDDFGRL